VAGGMNMAESPAAGVRMVDISTPKGPFRVWTRRVGDNPRIKVLLLHGGPGGTHTIYQCFDDVFPVAGFEYYYYDQLGSHWSDQPDDDDLWTVGRFVDEVEQVRQALGLTRENFFLFGSSWGGLLALEYALAHQATLKGLIISSMMSSIPDYTKYANEVLARHMAPEILAEIRALEAEEDFKNPRYQELLTPFYTQHVLRMPENEWPEPATSSLKRINRHIYELMQGPSEFGARGRLANWDRKADLSRITVPMLVIGSTHNTMDPAHQRWMASQVRRGRYVHCPYGSHLPMWDDPNSFFAGLIQFIEDVDRGVFP